MEEKQIIKRLLESKSAMDFFGNTPEWKKDYKAYSLKIHPDLCKEQNCAEAFTRLNRYKDELEKGLKHEDDAGSVTYNFKSVTIKGDVDFLKKSLTNYNKLMSLSDSASIAFKRYLPVSGRMTDDGELRFDLEFRSVPLSYLGDTEQLHVNWILSRMFEFSAWLTQVGFSHAGITPDSIYICPENHGMVCISFYHLTEIGSKLMTVSGKHQNLYPSYIFNDKVAVESLDLELSKRTAIYLLGDKSGTGTSLKKTHNEDVIDFLQKKSKDAFETYNEYRTLLKNNFDTKQFHKLTI